MKRFALTLPIFIGSLMMNPIKGDFLVDGVLTKTAESNKNKCISYVPKIGSVKEGEDINIDSDKFQITEDKRLILYGNVQLDFVDGLLRSQNAELDRENGRVEFSNEGEIFLKDFYFNALKGYLNKDDNSISLNNGMVFSQERNLVFNFDYLTGVLDEKILLTNASMSSCADPSSGWILEAEEIALDSTANRGLAKNIKIKAAGTTIFAFPYIPFATSDERMSGFLEPSISYSSDGIDLMIPYYKVISERSDFTVAPRHIAKRGSGFEFNYRSLHGNNSNLRNLDLIYFDKDDELKNEYLKENYSRWAYKYNDTFNFLFTNISIDWSKASDALLFRDIPGDITSIGYQRSQSLNQNISVETKLKNIEITVEHQSYQSLNPILSNGYKKSIGINLSYFKNFGGLSIKERLNIANFNADKIHGYYGYQLHGDSLLRVIENPTEGKRIYSDLSISKHAHIKGININSSFGLTSIIYDLSRYSTKPKNVTIPNALLDLSSVFISYKNNGRHILEPKLILGYTGFKNQKNNPIFDSNEISFENDLFQNSRFSGMDRIGDQNFYTLSLGYKNINNNKNNISLRVSKKYYLKDRKVFMNHSMFAIDEDPLLISGTWTPNSKTLINSYTGYTNGNNDLQLGGFTIKQKLDFGFIGYAKKYRKIAGDFNIEMDYSELFADIDINPSFKLIAQLKRDDSTKTNIESLFGIEYENCCLALRITTSDRNYSKYNLNQEILYPHLADAWDNMIYIESKSRINFEFELKGLNSSFDRANRLLNNSLFKN